MSVAVIIVNYGTADLAIDAVESVLGHQHGGRAVEVHLVDNASPQGDAARFEKEHDARGWGARVTLWPEAENHGFGRGNNLVLKALAACETPPDYTFLLNPDALIENEAIDILASYLDAHDKVAAAGAGVAMPDGRKVAAAFRFPGLAHEIATVINFGPVSSLLRTRMAPLAPDHPTGAVGWLTGAAVMFRLSALRAVGFFDPAYFLYFEEVDLMHRLGEAGWERHYVPEARVVHREGVATNVESSAQDRRRRPDYVYRSWRRYFTKTQGRFGALGLAIALWVAAIPGLIAARLLGRNPRFPLHFFRDHWRYVIGPLAGFRRDPIYDADTRRNAASEVVFEPYVTKSQRGLVNANPPGIGFWALVAEDFRTFDSGFFDQGFWALFWHRYGNWRMSVRPRLLRMPCSLVYKVMHKLTQWFCSIDLPYSVVVGRRVKIEHFGGMILVAERIGNDVTIRQNTTFGIAGLHNKTGRPTIENGVEIGVGAVLIGEITIGDNAVIGANAVVVRDVPANHVAIGVPAQIVPKSSKMQQAIRHG